MFMKRIFTGHLQVITSMLKRGIYSTCQSIMRKITNTSISLIMSTRKCIMRLKDLTSLHQLMSIITKPSTKITNLHTH